MVCVKLGHVILITNGFFSGIKKEKVNWCQYYDVLIQKGLSVRQMNCSSEKNTDKEDRYWS